jgi:hypothetical protein
MPGMWGIDPKAQVWKEAPFEKSGAASYRMSFFFNILAETGTLFYA